MGELTFQSWEQLHMLDANEFRFYHIQAPNAYVFRLWQRDEHHLDLIVS